MLSGARLNHRHLKRKYHERGLIFPASVATRPREALQAPARIDRDLASDSGQEPLVPPVATPENVLPDRNTNAEIRRYTVNRRPSPSRLIMNKVRIGIIGMGNMGKHHAAYLLDKKVSRGELTAVCSTSPKKL